MDFSMAVSAPMSLRASVLLWRPLKASVTSSPLSVMTLACPPLHLGHLLPLSPRGFELAGLRPVRDKRGRLLPLPCLQNLIVIVATIYLVFRPTKQAFIRTLFTIPPPSHRNLSSILPNRNDFISLRFFNISLMPRRSAPVPLP